MNNQENRAGLTVAICAPSGAGKSYITQSVHESFPGSFQEAVVATTRQERYGITELNRMFLTEDEFNDALEIEQIILPHRPFEYEGAPLYGFMSHILEFEKNIITEVHASIIDPFKKILSSKPTIILGLFAPDSELELNLMKRSGGTSDGVTVEQRMEHAVYEKQLIIEAAELGYVDAIVPYFSEKRIETEAFILDAVAGFIKRNGHES